MSPADAMAASSNLPKAIIPFNNSYVQVYQGSYKLEVLNSKFESLFYLERPFERVPYKSTFKPSGKELNMAEKMMLASEESRGGFLEDIESFTGTYKDYLLISTVSGKDNSYDIDILDKDLNYYSKLTLETNNKLLKNSIHMDQDYLIVPMLSEDIGPYVEIYRIEKN
ncbi:MAG: hypothetical protein KDD94_01920 [Calditrichaeota bacterium]|nr:hypothetical protein [Calditrichota bacterium]